MSVDEDQIWNGVAGIAALAAAAAAKPLMARTWKAVSGKEAPGDPAHQDVSWKEAIAWAVLTGAVVGVVRLVAQRSAASAWAKARGDYPAALRTTRP